MSLVPPSGKHSSVARRLALGFGALVALSLAGFGASAWQARALSASIERVVQLNYAMSDAAARLRFEMDELSIQARTVALMTEMKSVSAEMDRVKAAKEKYQRDEKALQA